MKQKNVVTIGGGTGSFTLLSGLKKYPINLTAIVSMADDGGSTGVLRDELGVLPPGDVRQCLVALSDSEEILRKLLNYRFEEGGLKGHSFGNLFLSALEKISGNFNTAVQEAIKILKVKGDVVPVTDNESNLFIELKDRKVLKGENEINHNFEIQEKGIRKIFYSPKVRANPKAIRKIMDADLIVIGPGNHFCSIVPNLLVKGISEAIRKSKSKVVLNCNLVNKKGHTEGYSLDDYADSINDYLGSSRIDFVTWNSQLPNRQLIKKYEDQKELLIRFSESDRKKRSYRIIQNNLLSPQKVKFSRADILANKRSFIRHDSDKLAKILVMILEMGSYEDIIKKII
jgi:uncharacterized cofD-like protein